jgi:hypothetical protein
MLFNLFSFSFGKMMLKTEYAPLTFLGQILPQYELSPPQNNIRKFVRKFIAKPNTSVLDKLNHESQEAFTYNIKPASTIAFDSEKPVLLYKVTPELIAPERKEPSIMFHPLLPYQLQLYFKDRQVVHIELEFNIIPRGQKNAILIKRRVSSGNLEADLLSARYISRYLFIQQARFLPNNWQTVKIDLSTKR